MKTLVALLFSSLLLFGWNTSAAQNASARLFCLSPKVSRGVGVWDSTLDLTSINSGINGELAPSASSYDQEATIFMFNELWLDEPIQGSLFLDLPVFYGFQRRWFR